MPKMLVKEYAKHRGIHDRKVREFIEQGLIPTKAISRLGRAYIVDSTKADKALDENMAYRRKDIIPAKVVSLKEKKKLTAKAGVETLNYNQARTLSQQYKAALLKIELDRATGKLLDADDVRKAAFDKGRQVRDAILNIPDRISAILAAECSQSRVTAILDKELKQALEELSR